MASKLRKQVEASQKFLTGVKSLTNFSGTRDRQLAALLASLDRLPCCSMAQAADIFEAWQEDLWGREATESFSSHLTSRVRDTANVVTSFAESSQSASIFDAHLLG